MGERPGLPGAAFFDHYTDPREERGKDAANIPYEGNVGGFMSTRLS